MSESEENLGEQIDIIDINESKVDSLEIDKYYPPSSLRKPECVADIGRDVFGLHHIYGFDLQRRTNLFFIEDDRIVFVAGTNVVFQNIIDGRREFLLSTGENGVGCITVHPSR
jgi:hypothetical protein